MDAFVFSEWLERKECLRLFFDVEILGLTSLLYRFRGFPNPFHPRFPALRGDYRFCDRFSLVSEKVRFPSGRPPRFWGDRGERGLDPFGSA